MKTNNVPVRTLLLTFCFLIFFLQIALPQKDTTSGARKKQPVYTTTRLTTSKPVIDGKLDDECWSTGTWAGNWHQFIPSEGAEPSYPTDMKILYDDKNLYVAFRAWDDEPGKVHRYAGGRDSFEGDMIGVNFDSYHDYRTGFEFTVTAWGQKIDLILFNPDNWDVNWTAVWKVKTAIEDSAWVAEMEIPFSQLRYSVQNDQVWGMHTWRWIDRKQEESNWEQQSKTGAGMLYNFGELHGINSLPKSRRLEIMPYGLTKLTTMEKEAGNPFTEKGRAFNGNLGLDAKYGISSNFTLDLTINPDFGQVESDPSVMNLTAFETFYEEKRPFFLEGLTIFDFDFDEESIFYSRRIGHSPSREIFPSPNTFVKSPDMTTIADAVKISGTTSDGLSVGFIQSLTGPEYAKVTDIFGDTRHSVVEPLTNYTVARVQKGYKAGTTVIGGMLTSTNRFMNGTDLSFLPENAYTGGFDIIHRWKDKEFFIDAKLIGSHVTGNVDAIKLLQESSARYFQRPEASYLDFDSTRTSLSGFGGKIKIGKGAKGFWRYSTALKWLSPGLELNDLGYMQTADEINNENEISYFVNQPVSIFRTYSINLEQFNSWNFGGKFLGTGGHLSFSSEFKNQWGLGVNLIYHTSGPDSRLLRGGYDFIMPYRIMAFGNMKTDPSKKVNANIQYSFQSMGNDALSTYSVTPGVSMRPMRTLRFTVSATWEESRNDLQYVSTIKNTSSSRYILGRIDQKTLGLTFRADLNITPEFSIQYYGSPFISRGSYSQFKNVTNGSAGNYEDRFSLINNPSLAGGNYNVDENGDLVTDYAFANPDFNFHEFRSNLVAKWEYRLGSFIYFVWSTDKNGLTSDPASSLGESFRKLNKVFPRNIFLVKLNYWFTL
ncbi:MAG: DUF5916 domain-containing protein [Bacteroidales bacterium]